MLLASTSLRCLTKVKDGGICNLRLLSKRRALSIQNPVLRISEEVRDAVQEKRSVVALETTIYTHGYPYPENLQLATQLESIVRANGGVPATIGVVNGVATIGLSLKELEQLTTDHEARKISRRDLGFICGSGLYGGRRLNGGTTISGTALLAHLGGIKVFATGGLGGVHKHGESSLDISADLTELGRTPVAVISSGCKGFLDIPRTLEYLETEGVLVATFADGRSGDVDFPAFWTRDSGVRSPMVVENETQAAKMIYAQSALGLTSGLLLANPVPKEHEIPLAEMSTIIDKALRAADEEGATGSANTPSVLNAIKELSNGRSLPANRALIESNVKRGAKIASELAFLEKDDSKTPQASFNAHWNPKELLSGSRPEPLGTQIQPKNYSSVDILVAGSIAIDLACDYTPERASFREATPKLHTSNPATILQSVGGVGYNIAQAAHAAGASVRLCSAVADDQAGTAALNAARASGLDVGAVNTLPSTANRKTSQYVSFNDVQKDLVMAMADMRILETSHEYFDDTTIAQRIQDSKPSWLVLDANWDTNTLTKWIKWATDASVPVAFEPVSAAKASRIFTGQPDRISAFPYHAIELASPNALELNSMHRAANELGFFERDDWWNVIDAIGISSAGARAELVQATSAELVDAGIPQQSIQLLPFIPKLVTKLGPQGVLLTQLLPSNDDRLRSATALPHILSRTKQESGEVGGVYMRLFPVPEPVSSDAIMSTNGAGDSMLGVLMAGLVARKGQRVENAVDIAQAASALTLKSREAVSPEIKRLKNLLRGAT